MSEPALRRPYVALCRALIAAAAVTGITIECVHTDPLRVFTFFTILTNAAIAITFAWSAHRATTGRPPLSPRITGAVLLCIVITGLVYHLVLANESSGFSEAENLAQRTGDLILSNQLLHTVTPVTVTLDWLLLTTPARFQWRYAYQWLALPLAYAAFALLRGPLIDPPNRYPYPFLDVDLHGYPAVLRNAAVLALAFSALALLLITLDRTRPRLPTQENRISSPASRPLK
ncbi:Pr6Pr family membrane protein [Streptomyces sp. DSM 41987]|uniref:Pr6Pr family membrane protein n=1 Tax=Streptomyces TaxID=1883 RepID=UPI0018DFEFBD|nr:Pr6Pr family membrane protein [Streptomyces fildesensis]